MEHPLLKHIKIRPAMADIIGDIEPSPVVYDLCCDHGNLGIACLLLNKADKCVFVDKMKPIIEDLRKKISLYAENELSARCKYVVKSAEQLQEDFTGNVVIIGVGAKLSLKILGWVLPRGKTPLSIFVSPENAGENFLSQLREINPHFVKRKSYYHLSV